MFIDEIHRIARPAEEMLYLAMEDFRVDVVVGKGPGATSIPLEVAPFTLVGATTRSGALTGPLRDRFGFTAHMDFYEPAELERVLTRSAGILGIELGADAGAEIARRSRGTPRIANRLLRRVRDYAEVRADGVITRDIAKYALAVYDVDELGLDRLDRAVLSALTRSFGGGPVGVSTLAVAVGEEADHRRGGVRAVPGAGRDDRPHPARPRRHPTRLDPPRDDPPPAAVGWASRACSNRVVMPRNDFRGARRAAARLHLRDGVADVDLAAHPRGVRHHAEEAETTKLLAFNQGFYNLFLAIVTGVGIVAIASGTSDRRRTGVRRRRLDAGRRGGAAGLVAGQGARRRHAGRLPADRGRAAGDRGGVAFVASVKLLEDLAIVRVDHDRRADLGRVACVE